MDGLELLKQKIDEKSIGKVAREVGVSKATISLIKRGKYKADPRKILQKVKETYGLQTEIIGADTTATLEDLAKDLECI